MKIILKVSEDDEAIIDDVRAITLTDAHDLWKRILVASGFSPEAVKEFYEDLQ